MGGGAYQKDGSWAYSSGEDFDYTNWALGRTNDDGDAYLLSFKWHLKGNDQSYFQWWDVSFTSRFFVNPNHNMYTFEKKKYNVQCLKKRQVYY